MTDNFINTIPPEKFSLKNNKKSQKSSLQIPGKQIQEKINVLIFKDKENFCYNFRSLFEIKDSIALKRCKNSEIIVDNKINKLLFSSCKNMTIRCSYLVNGIEIYKCKNITLILNEDFVIPSIDCFDSTILIKLNHKQRKPLILNEKSKIIFR